jgi:hypothetical protein
MKNYKIRSFVVGFTAFMLMLWASIAISAPKYYVDFNGVVHAAGIVTSGTSTLGIMHLSSVGNAFLTSSPVYANNFNVAHAAAAAAGGSVVVDSDCITAGTITTSVPVIVTSGTISQVGIDRVHFGDSFDAPDRQAFVGFDAGDITGLKDANATWWGADGSEGNTTDSYAAIQSAIDAISSDATGTIDVYASRGMNARTFKLPSGKYNTSQGLSIPSGVNFDGQNSVITAMTTSQDIVEFRWNTGYGYYGTFMGGMSNIVLDGAGLAQNCLKLNKVNWANFANIVATKCVTGGLLQEVQYNTFTQATFAENTDGLVLTFAPDQPTLTSIDNSFHNISANKNTRYGAVVHRAGNNSFYRMDASRNLNADLVLGGNLYGTGGSAGNNHFYDYKSEHNRDDVPTSGYSIIIGMGASNAYGNSFYNPSIQRQPSGTTYDPYFKWLYNGCPGTLFHNPYEINTAMTLLENPLVPGDFSIFTVDSFSGLLVNYGSHWQHTYVPQAATDEDDVVIVGDSRYSYTHHMQGGLSTNKLNLDGAQYSSDIVLNTTTAGESDYSFQLTSAGLMSWGTGSGAVDTTLYRPNLLPNTLRTGGDFIVDNVLYASDTIRASNITPNVKNIPSYFASGSFDVTGTIASIATTAVTNTSGAIYAVKIAPTFNQASGTGINTLLYINPTYTAVSSGIQYAIRFQEVGATSPAFAVTREGFISSATGTSVASGTTIALTGRVTPITGSSAIATISLPYTGFQGAIDLIPSDASTFTTTTAGNIAIPSTAVTGRALRMTYVPATNKWYPSY